MVIIVLFIMGTYIYLSQEAVETEGETLVRSAQLEQARLQPIQKYVTDCLELSLQEGLDLLGTQGGVIYKSQGGIIPDYVNESYGKKYTVYGNKKIKMGITTDQLPVSIPNYPFYFSGDNYPRMYFPFENASGKKTDYPYYGGHFGWIDLNFINRSVNTPPNIQEQLEVYVENQTIKCTDWEIFPGLIFIEEKPNATLILADQDLTLTLSWPIIIKDEATGATGRINNFIVNNPVRLRKFFLDINSILEHEVNNISFDITKNKPQNIDDSIEISVINDIDEFNTDIIVFQDKEVIIMDQPYKFYIARMNRQPALFYIEDDWNNTNYRLCGEVSYFDSVPGVDMIDLVANSRACKSCSNLEEENSYTFGKKTIKVYSIDPDEDKIEFFIVPNKNTEEIDKVYTKDNVGDVVSSIFIYVSDSILADKQELYFKTLECI